MLIRTRFVKGSTLRFISHLDLVRVFHRAVRRARLPIEFSKGYNPHPKISFGSALAVGCTSEAEFVDFELTDEVSPKEFIKRLNDALPYGIKVLEAKEVPKNTPSLMSKINTAIYCIALELPKGLSSSEVKQRIKRFMELKTIRIKKLKKNRQKEMDIRNLIYELDVLDIKNGCVEIKAVVKIGNMGSVNPEMLVQAFNNYKIFSEDVRLKRAHRKGLFIKTRDGLISPIQKGTEQ